MADNFLAEIRIVPYTFAPTGWAFCSGQVMPILQNTALFSLLGVTYGGNGVSTFGLPNLAGRMPMHQGQGSGLAFHALGEMGGAETVTLQPAQIGPHAHGLNASLDGTPGTSPASGVFAPAPDKPFHPGPADTTLSAAVVSPAGGSQPHNNMPPYLALNFVIALQGIFPPRS